LAGLEKKSIFSSVCMDHSWLVWRPVVAKFWQYSQLHIGGVRRFYQQ